MAGAYEGLYVEFRADTTSLTSALRKVGSEANSAQRDVNRLEKALKLDPSNVELLEAKQRKASQAADLLRERLDVINQTLASGKVEKGSEAYDRLQLDLSKTTQQLARMDTASKDAAEALQRVRSGAVEAEAALERNAQRAKEAADRYTELATKAGRVSEVAGRAGDALTFGVTAPLAAAGAGAVKVATDFEDSMAQVAGALGEPADAMGALRDLALQTGQDTIFSASEAGSAMVELAKGGLTQADIAGGALSSTMDLAAAGGLDLAEAANTIVQSMGAFGLTADETGRAANALAGSANASSADVGDLTYALSQCSASASNAGWSIEDTTAVLGMFADAGLTGSDAGTSLKTMLSSLAAPTGAAATQLEELGIQTRDSEGHLLSASEVAEQLSSKLGTLDDATRDAALQTIFGSDAMRAASVFMNEGAEGLQKYTDATHDQTSASRMAQSQMSDTARAIEEAKGAVETAAIKLGGALAPSVRNAANLVGGLAEAFSGMGEGGQRAALAVAGLAAATGPLLKGVQVAAKGGELLNTALATMRTRAAEAKTGISNVGTAAKTTATTTSALGGVLKGLGAGLALGAVAAAVGYIGTKAQEAKEHADRLDQALSLSEARTSVRELGDEAGDAEGDVKSLLDRCEEALSAQAQLAQDARDKWAEVNGDKSELQGYVDTIADLRDKAGLTKEEQAKLTKAVEGYNKITGDTLKVVDPLNGKLDENQTHVQSVADAWYQAAQNQAAYNLMADAMEGKLGEEQLLGDLDEQIEDAKKRAEEGWAVKIGPSGGNQVGIDLNPTDDRGKEALTELDQLTKAREEAQSRLDEYNETIADYQRVLDESSESTLASTQALTDWASANETVQAGLEGTGRSTEEFAQALHTIGVGTDELASLTPEQLGEVVSSFDGSAGSIENSLYRMGKASFYAKDSLVSAFSETMPQVKEALGGSDEALDSFATSVADAGVSIEDLSTIGADNMAKLAQSFADGQTDIRASLAELGYAIDENGYVVKVAAEGVGESASEGVAPTDTTPTEQAMHEQANAVTEGGDGMQQAAQDAAQKTDEGLAPPDGSGVSQQWDERMQELVDSSSAIIANGSGDIAQAFTSAWQSAPADAKQYGGQAVAFFAAALDGGAIDVQSAAQVLAAAASPDSNAAIANLPQEWQGLASALVGALSNVSAQTGQPMEEVVSSIIGPLSSLSPEMAQALAGLGIDLGGSIDAAAPSVKAASDRLGAVPLGSLGLVGPKLAVLGRGFPAALASGIGEGAGTQVGSAFALLAQGVHELDGVPGEAQGIGAQAGVGFGTGVGQDAGTSAASAQLLGQRAYDALNAWPDQMGKRGTRAALSLAAGVASGTDEASSAASALSQAGVSGVSPLPGRMSQVGARAGASLAAGVGSQQGAAFSAAASLAASASAGLGYLDFYDSGAEAGSSFAAGIASQVRAVAAASAALAAANAAYLHHTTPDVGPMRGDDEWGYEAGRQIAEGLSRAVPDVARASKAVALAASRAMPDVSAAQPRAVKPAPSYTTNNSPSYVINIDGAQVGAQGVEGEVLALVQGLRRLGRMRG